MLTRSTPSASGREFETAPSGLSALQNGDTVELEIDSIGKLVVKVQDDLNRTWARETRLEREQKGLKGYTPQLTGKYAKA